MKGIVLAGGLGTRLASLTRITNKHLLPVYDEPMIYFPIRNLCEAGIREIMIVTGGNNAGDFLRLLGNGQSFGLDRLHYAYQEGEGGIADALRCAKSFTKDEAMVVLLGDNIFEFSIRESVRKFQEDPTGAMILLKEVEDCRRFGVPEIKEERIVSIEEKPKEPKSSFAVTGAYLYDAQVWDILETLRPSGRGELEITDVNNAYIQRGQMRYDMVQGWWTDAGTIESLFRANRRVEEERWKGKDGAK